MYQALMQFQSKLNMTLWKGYWELSELCVLSWQSTAAAARRSANSQSAPVQKISENERMLNGRGLCKPMFIQFKHSHIMRLKKFLTKQLLNTIVKKGKEFLNRAMKSKGNNNNIHLPIFLGALNLPHFLLMSFSLFPLFSHPSKTLPKNNLN